MIFFGVGILYGNGCNYFIYDRKAHNIPCMKRFILIFTSDCWCLVRTPPLGEDEENWQNDPKMGLAIDYRVRGMMVMQMGKFKYQT